MKIAIPTDTKMSMLTLMTLSFHMVTPQITSVGYKKASQTMEVWRQFTLIRRYIFNSDI